MPERRVEDPEEEVPDAVDEAGFPSVPEEDGAAVAPEDDCLGANLGAAKSFKTAESTALATSTVAMNVCAGARVTSQVAMMEPGWTDLGSGESVTRPSW